MNPGVSESEIVDAEKVMGFTFPRDLRESLMRHNGTGDAWPALATLKQITKSEEIWCDLLRQGAFERKRGHDASAGTGKTQLGWWVKGWIPIQDDSQGNGLVVDTCPGIHGEFGQLIYMDHESTTGPSMSKLTNYVAYLSKAAGELHSGEYVYLSKERIVVEKAEAKYYQKNQI